MLSKLTSHDAMQIKISFAAAYDFNQLIHAVCSPPQPLPAPQILTPSPPRPALWGRGGSPPRENDQNREQVAGQNKGPNINFLQ